MSRIPLLRFRYCIVQIPSALDPPTHISGISLFPSSLILHLHVTVASELNSAIYKLASSEKTSVPVDGTSLSN